tara:strand:+ start:564 stop:737 length:174 start_codon:yes stop_codon:yes gene_type:complete
MSYKKVKRTVVNGVSLPEEVIRRISDGAFIPINEANRDYQEYLEWAAIEGNTIQELD